MVLEIRDLWPEVPIAVGALKNPLLVFLARRLESIAYFNSDQIVGLSPGMCDGIIKSGYDFKNVHLIPNSSDIKQFKINNTYGDAFRDKYSIPKNSPLIIYAGTLGKINGVSYLVDISYEFLSLNPDVRFVIVGSGIEEDAIRNKSIRNATYDKNLIMIDRLQKAKCQVYSMRHQFLHPFFFRLKKWKQTALISFLIHSQLDGQ